MTLEPARALPDYEAQDDLAAYACPDCSMCSEFLEEPEKPSKRADRIATLIVVALILLAWGLGAWLDEIGG